MKILKVIKNNIIGIVVGVVAACSINVGAVIIFSSNDVIYDNSNSGVESTTVQGALDQLYGKLNEKLDNVEHNPYYVGKEIYYNPVSGTKCFDYTSANSLNENKTGCMKWNIIGEGTDTVDMILDHNTTQQYPWISNSDYNTHNADQTQCNHESCNDEGPITLLNKLQSDTSGWIGVPTRTDSYIDPAKGYTINYNGYRARLISANEIAKITGASWILKWDTKLPYNDNTVVGESIANYYLDGKYGTSALWQSGIANSQGTSKFSWLFDNTFACIYFGCNTADNGNYGFWTSSASTAGQPNAWYIYSEGIVANFNTYGTLVGLRPVITIAKSTI